MNEEELKQMALERGYEFISIEYIMKSNRRRKFINLKCLEHGHEVQLRYDAFQNCRSCPTCYGKRKSNEVITEDEVKRMVAEKGFKFIEFVEFKGARSRVIVECEHGHKWNTLLSSIRVGYNCPKCSPNHRWDYDEVKEYVESFGYELLDTTYKNCDEPLTLRCPHGHVHTNTLAHFVHDGTRCSVCRESKGENNVRQFLEDNGIEYRRQERFDNCRFRIHLPFDFYIPSMNVCIEFDGEQHYIPVDYSGKKTPLELQEDFELRMIKDHIKNVYCKQHNITLIRIPYWDKENVDTYLTQLIN